ncbi:MAG: hypothetical protein JWN44_5198 [Myxococcales bacterium]|nr:hypothetical protein [Myxococcales bacterium]
MRVWPLLALLLSMSSCSHKTTTFPTCSDKLTNGDESDVDCGGGLCPLCNTGKACRLETDCRSKLCVGGACAPATCDDKTLNGSESDVDCGGPSCPACGVDALCAGYNDCVSQVCAGGRCAAPSCNDGFKNGDETNVDCGGACPPCD